MSPPGGVLIAERAGPTRAGLRLALSGADYSVVAEAGDREGAIAAALEHRPDVALVSTDLPDGGIDAARIVAERVPSTKVVVLSPRLDGQELVAAVLAGAVGYLSKEISAERLPLALRVCCVARWRCRVGSRSSFSMSSVAVTSSAPSLRPTRAAR